MRYILLTLLAGCVISSPTVTDGTRISAGLHVPGAESTTSLQVFSYLSGFHLDVPDATRIELYYTISETNDFFKVIRTQTTKNIRAVVTRPTEVSAHTNP